MTKPRAVLDTNLFYYSAGISKDARLRDDWLAILEADYSLSLASPTIIEVLTNPDLDEAQLWTCLDHMFSGRFIDTVQIGYVPFDVNPVRDVAARRDSAALQRLRDDALRLKIAAEAGFLRFVAFGLIAGFLYAVLEDRRDGLSEQQTKSLTLHFKALLESNVELTLGAITNALVEGYARGDVKKTVESRLQDHLASFTHAALASLHIVLAGHRIDDVLEAPPDVQQKIAAAVQADPLYEQVTKAAHPLAVLRKRQFRESVETYLAGMRSDFEAHALMPSDVLDFFVNRLTGNLKSGAKYRKNDVFDLLLAFSVVAKDTVFVSNDDDVIEALETASPRSHALSLSLRR